MAKYKTTQATFIAPTLLREGTVFTIGDDYEPGPHLEPLDEAAEAAFDRYYSKRKEAGLAVPTLDPIEAVSNTITSIVDPSEEVADLSLSFAEAQASPAGKGPSDGGKVK